MMHISLVGTQIMAVLNPVLALRNAGHTLEGIELVATVRSYPVAKRAKAFLVQRGLFSEDRINVSTVSNILETDPVGRPPAREVAENIASGVENLSLNVAGGLNFQIAAVVNRMGPRKCLYIYPEANGIHTMTIGSDSSFNDIILPLPEPQEVLDLQGIAYSMMKETGNAFFTDVLERSRVEMPLVRGVRIRKGNLRRGMESRQ